MQNELSTPGPAGDGLSSYLALELAFEPLRGQVSAVRAFLESYFEPALKDPDLVCRMAVAAHELMENALRYSRGGPARLRVEVKREGATDTLIVSVTNRPALEHLDALAGILADLEVDQDLDALYLRYITRAATLKGEGSGLGLVRIRAEAEMDLSLELCGETACVSASVQFENEHA